MKVSSNSETIFFLGVKQLTLLLPEKINYLRFLPKFYCNIYAFRGFQILKFFMDISFRLQGENIGLQIFF